jgi:hypothetical protein
MRSFAFAALVGLTLAAAASADARAWTDPAGRVAFEAPDNWSIQDQQQTSMTYVIAGTANNECHVLAIPRAQTASMSVDAIRNAGGNDANYTDEAWARVGGAMTSVFSSAPQVLSRSEDTTQFWPIQRADLQGQRLVHAAIQLRPGLELQTYCQTYEGADDAAAYDALIRSVKTPTDEALQQQASPAAP